MKNFLVGLNMNNNEIRNANVKLSGTTGNITSIDSNGYIADSSISVSDANQNIVTSAEFTSLYTKLNITS